MSTRTTGAQREPDEAIAVNGGGATTAAAPRRARLTLVRTPPWNHTLILRGSLDERSASELEDEIECLREEGVSSLTLDLRELDAVEEPAMEVIASQGASFRSGGRTFAVLAETGGGRPFGAQPSSGAWETTMVRELGGN
jgi:hypothetical protein